MSLLPLFGLRRDCGARALAAAALAAASFGCAPTRAQVWFGPNLGSVDMVELFRQPEAWRSARRSTDVFKFYEQQLLAKDPAECRGCGPNVLPAFERAAAFSRLGDWGIEIAIEVPVVKSHTCSAEVNAESAVEAIRNVRQRGGRVRYLAPDEPLLGAQTCQLSLDEAATRFAVFVQQVRRAEPAVGIGEIEPYPAFDLATLTSWMDALRREGAPPAFFHLDVDRQRAAREGRDLAADLAGFRQMVEGQAIPFGVIFSGADGTDEAAYGADVLAWVGTVRTAIGTPMQAVFQSWSVSEDGRFTVPRNLPESDGETLTHTRLLNEGLRTLRSGTPPDP